MVSFKKKQGVVDLRKNSKIAEGITIYMVNIPIEVKAKAIWDFFMQFGQIKDIVLPRRRYKNNKRIGFIKTTSELEAGIIINNAKEKDGWGRRIIISINKVSQSSPKSVRTEAILNSNKGVVRTHEVKTNDTEMDDFSTKMFEFTETVIYKRVEEGLFQSLVGFSWREETVESLQKNIKDEGLGNISIVRLSDRKFLLKNEEELSWKDNDFKAFSKWFSVVRKFKETYLVLPRTVWLECIGLPMTD